MVVLLVGGLCSYRAYVRFEQRSRKFTPTMMTPADERVIRDQVAIVAAQFRQPTKVNVRLERLTETEATWIGMIEGGDDPHDVFSRVREAVHPGWDGSLESGPILAGQGLEVLFFRFEGLDSGGTSVMVSGASKRLTRK